MLVRPCQNQLGEADSAPENAVPVHREEVGDIVRVQVLGPAPDELGGLRHRHVLAEGDELRRHQPTGVVVLVLEQGSDVRGPCHALQGPGGHLFGQAAQNVRGDIWARLVQHLRQLLGPQLLSDLDGLVRLQLLDDRSQAAGWQDAQQDGPGLAAELKHDVGLVRWPQPGEPCHCLDGQVAFQQIVDRLGDRTEGYRLPGQTGDVLCCGALLH